MTLATQVSHRKAAARTALVDLKDSSRLILSECFRQFGIESIALNGKAADRLQKEKFDACVVKLSPGAETVMDVVRSSPSNNRMVIYGVGGSVQDCMKFSKYGINAVFNEPLERQTALKLVRSTQMLVLHEFRRYVRVPVITEIAVTAGEKLYRDQPGDQFGRYVAQVSGCSEPRAGDGDFLRATHLAAALGEGQRHLAESAEGDVWLALRCAGRAAKKDPAVGGSVSGELGISTSAYALCHLERRCWTACGPISQPKDPVSAYSGTDPFRSF